MPADFGRSYAQSAYVFRQFVYKHAIFHQNGRNIVVTAMHSNDVAPNAQIRCAFLKFGKIKNIHPHVCIFIVKNVRIYNYLCRDVS